MTVKKIEDTGNLKREHYIAMCGELTLEEDTKLSQDGLHFAAPDSPVTGRCEHGEDVLISVKGERNLLTS
jgi:hypothetical protein